MPLLLLGYFAYISLGLPDGMLGVAWPHLREELGQPVGAVGYLLVAVVTGYLISSIGAGFTTTRLGVGRLLAASTGLTAVGLLGYALSPVLVTVVAAALVLGLGAGAIDAGLNAYAARHFGARHMNWLHASYGLGATLGPLVITGVLAAGLSWRWGYAAVALAQSALATSFGLSARAWRDGARNPEQPAASVAVLRTLALPAVWRGAAAFAVYVAVEVAAGLFAYTLLTEGRGMSERLAGLAVSAYWGSLFVGRLAVGVVVGRVGVHRVLTASVLGLVAGAGLVAVPAPGWLAVIGLMLVGLAAAPVFPMLTLTTAERVGEGHADRAIGMQVGASAVGGTALPAVIGVLIGAHGPEVLGPALLALTIALTLLVLRRS
jgi:fucose permease